MYLILDVIEVSFALAVEGVFYLMTSKDSFFLSCRSFILALYTE